MPFENIYDVQALRKAKGVFLPVTGDDDAASLSWNYWSSLGGLLARGALRSRQIFYQGQMQWLADGIGLPEDIDTEVNLADHLMVWQRDSNNCPWWLSSIWPLVSIIWFSDYCVFDLSTATKHLRQVYVNGEAVSPVQDTQLVSPHPYVCFQFGVGRYLSPASATRLKQVWQKWKDRDLRHANRSSAIRTSVAGRLNVNAEYDYQFVAHFERESRAMQECED